MEKFYLSLRQYKSQKTSNSIYSPSDFYNFAKNYIYFYTSWYITTIIDFTLSKLRFTQKLTHFFAIYSFLNLRLFIGITFLTPEEYPPDFYYIRSASDYMIFVYKEIPLFSPFEKWYFLCI